ncbi:polyprenyl synthetase family protein [uncultured Campylobacter sp.]|uniref:polyprenyl synthetase family protein n=1 Tax=uncultured Campylobacter sp. TaxID=218934 RepID=UPI002621FFC0|nr:polyprenyl synthetase family protein [uncultured Campylobacter sp.]
MEKIDLIMKNFIAELGYEPATAMFARINSGKRLRSKLLLKIAGESEQSLKICAIIELIHLASLLHDDVIDDADTRRGSPSINASFGTKNAVMLGDILYSKGFYELSKFPHEIAGEISGAVSKLSIGEMMDVDLSAKFNEDKSAYETMIYYKTAVLIEAAAAVGAMLAGLDARNFKIYGKNLGLAFQIIDDILDVTQDAATLGKPNFSDFKEGKTTLPYIYLYESLSEADKEKLKSLFKKDLSESEQGWVRAKMNETGAIKKSIEAAKNLGEQAIRSVEKFNIDGLENIVKSMIDREF